MAENEFPGSLPAGYREIWSALSAADRESPSRQALASHLGVSTHTIQRILVDGAVPDLATTSNTRVLRAWVRIITRLSHRFGREPRIWVEAAGVPWDDTVAGVVKETLDRLTARETGIRPELGAAAVEETVPEVFGYEFPAEVSVDIVSGGPLALPVGGSGGSFMETYVSRLIGAVRPDCRISMTASDEATLTGRLKDAVGGTRLLAGVADTLSLRMAGLDVVSLPGLKTRLSALCLRPRRLEVRAPGWLEAVFDEASGAIRYLVRPDGLAHRFLKGQGGVADESLIVREMTRIEEVADSLLMETSLWESSMHLERWVVLVGDEEACHAVKLVLDGRDEVRRDYSVEYLRGAPHDFPAYQVAIALPARRQEVRDLLRAATRLELFGSGAALTAGLYARLLAAGFMGRNLGNLINPSVSNGPHILVDFPAAGVFRDVLCEELVRILEDRIDETIDSRRIFKTRDAVTAQARYLAAEHARNLVPPAWHESVDRVAPRPVREPDRDLLRVPARHCLSCSASLLDEHHRGVSDRYCRVCSDETGTLRPRAEVEGIIAGWFEQWHGGLDHRDALRQAKDFMERMPAWCNN